MISNHLHFSNLTIECNHINFSNSGRFFHSIEIRYCSSLLLFVIFPLALLHIYTRMFLTMQFIISFQLITTTRSLVLCAESRREMEDWLTALKAASLREYYEPGLTDTQDFLSNHHHWYVSIKIMSNNLCLSRKKNA